MPRGPTSINNGRSVSKGYHTVKPFTSDVLRRFSVYDSILLQKGFRTGCNTNTDKNKSSTKTLVLELKLVDSPQLVLSLVKG